MAIVKALLYLSEIDHYTEVECVRDMLPKKERKKREKILQLNLTYDLITIYVYFLLVSLKCFKTKPQTGKTKLLFYAYSF